MKITIALATSIGVGWLLAITSLALAQEDSLRSALNAVDRRQHDLGYKTPYDKGLRQYYPPEEDELEFIIPKERNEERKALERALVDYLEGGGEMNQDGSIKKRFSSSFRERIEEDKAHQRDDLSDAILNKMENEQIEPNSQDYANYIQSLYEKYKSGFPEFYDPVNVYNVEGIRKQPSDYYTNLGYDIAGLQKRNGYYDTDILNSPYYLYNYAPNRMQEEEEEVWEDTPAGYYNWELRKQRKRDRSYTYQYPAKNFAIAKRSSPSQEKHYLKRVPKSVPTTSPKVQKELTDIFGTSKPAIEDKPKKSMQKKKAALKPNKTEHGKDINREGNSTDIVAKEHLLEKKNNHSLPLKQDLLQIKKKSIDWSDYFGYDRKKKSDENLENEWLMERYHKAIAMGTKKNFPNRNERNLEFYPAVLERQKKKGPKNGEDDKLNDMDSKLRNIEDTIVDEALKYTGAHEGTTDSKEIQAVKDKVISQLAAAYSLEKMRQALEEYKKSVSKQKSQLKEKSNSPAILEDKRISVPRKQAIDHDREKVPKADNDIKCTQGNEDCDEQNYKAPSEIVEAQTYMAKECPKVQRACNEVAEVLGKYGPVLETACNMHQACLLCGENSWFAPTRQCNVLFLSKSDDICNDDTECQQVARHSVRYLLDINRSLKAEPSVECDLVCPDNQP